MIPYNEFKKNVEEIANKTHIEEQKNIQSNDITFIDLFCGVGGVRTGFSENGFKCVFSSDINNFSRYTYYANYGVAPVGDITKIKANEIPKHDILCAGFPCQPFSKVGKREGFKHETQGTMFHEVLRIADYHKPKVVFLENVEGLVNHDEGNTFKVVIDSLNDLGYKCFYEVINSADFGLPQRRRRIYIVAIYNFDKSFTFPQEKRHVDIGNFIEKDQPYLANYKISEHLQKSYLFKKPDGLPEIINDKSKGHVKTLLASYYKIQRLTGTFVQDENHGLRLLSEKECKAIMGFPEKFVIPVSRTQMYKQMGNSVTIPVVKAIAKQIKKEIFK